MKTEVVNGWKVNNLHDFCSNRSLILEALEHVSIPRSTKTIFIQDEHTLVLPGGRDVPQGTPIGSIRSFTNENYLVRLNNAKECIEANLIIDYAIPNIINLKNSVYWNYLRNKIVYAPSIPKQIDNFNIERPLKIITTFNDVSQKRRARLIDQLLKSELPYKNIQGIFGETQNMKLYSKSKILINIHQTDHHHTIEEFRVLPALAAGCIVIAEDSPLKKYIPYHPFIFWRKYQEITKTAAYILDNYDYIVSKLYQDHSLNKYLRWYRAKALQRLCSMLRSSSLINR